MVEAIREDRRPLSLRSVQEMEARTVADQIQELPTEVLSDIISWAVNGVNINEKLQNTPWLQMIGPYLTEAEGTRMLQEKAAIFMTIMRIRRGFKKLY